MRHWFSPRIAYDCRADGRAGPQIRPQWQVAACGLQRLQAHVVISGRGAMPALRSRASGRLTDLRTSGSTRSLAMAASRRGWWTFKPVLGAPFGTKCGTEAPPSPKNTGLWRLMEGRSAD